MKVTSCKQVPVCPLTTTMSDVLDKSEFHMTARTNSSTLNTHRHCAFINSFFKRFYFFSERGEEKETLMLKRNIDQLPLTCSQPGTRPGDSTQARALTGNQTHDPSLHKPALNSLSHTRLGYCFYHKNTFTVHYQYSLMIAAWVHLGLIPTTFAQSLLFLDI